MAHFQFKIKLRGVSKPPVWRKVDVPSNTPFDIFSQIIQDVFGWYGHHLWHFTPNAYGTYPVIAIPLPKDTMWAEDPDLNAANTKLCDIFHNEGDKFTYTYDFGDDWIHEIVLEKITDEESNKVYLLKAKGATPMEDCGGIMGHEHMKEVLANPQHPEYKAYCEWLAIDNGDGWDFNDPDVECGEIGEIEELM